MKTRFTAKHLKMLSAAVREHIGIMKCSYEHVNDPDVLRPLEEWEQLHELLQDELLRF